MLAASGPLPHVTRALTLHQPWASLIAEGLKTEETRGWPPPPNIIGTRIAIHAGKRKPTKYELELWDLNKSTDEDAPFGAIVCTAKLAGTFQVLGVEQVTGTVRIVEGRHRGALQQPYSADIYGDWSPGRWIWCLEDVRKLTRPVPTRGYQQVWAMPLVVQQAIQGYGG